MKLFAHTIYSENVADANYNTLANVEVQLQGNLNSIVTRANISGLPKRKRLLLFMAKEKAMKLDICLLSNAFSLILE